MFSRNHILLEDNHFTLHMMACMYLIPLLYENSDACFPNFGAARTPYLMYDVYTKKKLTRSVFPDSVYIASHFTIFSENLISDLTYMVDILFNIIEI